jgi:hypothetical protein
VQKLEFYVSEVESFPVWSSKIPSLRQLRMDGGAKAWNVPGTFRALQDLIINFSDLREVRC